MAEKLTLTAEVRTQIGKNANRRLRAAGIIPAVYYTADGSSVPVQVQEKAFTKLYATVGRTALFTLEFDNKGTKVSKACLVWDIEYYPTQNRYQHIDFYGVDLDRELRVRVPLVFTGVAKGTKLGGRLEIFREQIYIVSKAETLPSKIDVNISNIDVNQGLRVADLVMPQGVRAHYADNYAILNVNAPGSDKSDEDPI